jgi:glycerate 2-kinase
MHVLVAPDKFKGTLTAQAAAALIAQGWREVRPNDSLDLLPMSDGGDGFGQVMANLTQAEAHRIITIDAAHRPREATWWWHQSNQTAIIESAQVIGLTWLTSGQHHPFDLDTYGLGAVLRAASARQPARCLVGIGGSATNDGGFGMARSLGWTFLDDTLRPIERWINLRSLRSIRRPEAALVLSDLLVAVDVRNALLGPTGASRVYGPQKGLKPEDFALAEACLGRLAEVVRLDLGLDLASEPGTGAAGGLGFGLRCFLNARLESGFELYANSARLAERIAQADLVITGEGAIDRSTLMGKGVGELAGLCVMGKVPCWGLAGKLAIGQSNDREPVRPFERLWGIAPRLTSEEAAMREPEIWLPRLAAEAASAWR